MSRIVELSSGHVFDADSVRAITPIRDLRKYDAAIKANLSDGSGFDVVGVGYCVTIRGLSDLRADEGSIEDWRDYVRRKEQEFSALHAEAISKLLRTPDPGQFSSGLRK